MMISTTLISNIRLLVVYLLIISFQLLSGNVSASDVLGGSLTYKQVGGAQSLTYHLAVEVYYKCGQGTPQTPIVGINYGKCGVSLANSSTSPQVVRLIQRSQGSNEQFTSSVSAAQKCAGFSVPGYPVYPGQVQSYTYLFEVNLPSREQSWYFWADSREQRSRITSPADASNLPAYFEATLNNQVAAQNNGPSFFVAGNPIGFPERGITQIASFAANDPDGDSLAYELDSVAIACNQAAKQYQRIDSFIVFDTASIPARFGISSGQLSVKNPVASYFMFPFEGPDQAQNSRYVTGVFMNERTGTLSFGARYASALAMRNGLKEVFIAVVRVKKFRRINGQMTLIGTVMKEVSIEPVAQQSQHDILLDTLVAQQNQPTLDLRIQNPSDFKIKAFRGELYSWTLPFVNQGDSAMNVNIMSALPQGITATVINNNRKNAAIILTVDARNPLLPSHTTIPIELTSNNYPLLRTASYSLELELLAPIPSPTLISTGQSINCAGTGVNLSAPVGYDVVVWSTGQPDQSITVTNSGQYYAYLKLKSGGVLMSNPMSVNFAAPISPSLSDQNGVLTATEKANATYRWLVNGQEITTTTSPTFIPQVNGFYQVEIRIGNCAQISDQVKVDYTQLYDRKVQLYPNPAREVITIAAPRSLWAQSSKVKIYTVTGMFVGSFDIVPEKTGLATLSISGLIAGAYQLRFEGSNQVLGFVKW